MNKNDLSCIVCPLTKGPLIYQNNELISKEAKLAYPVINGIPILLIEEARKTEITIEFPDQDIRSHCED